MKSEIREKFDALRKRFIGSGEEHELLASLATDYSEAYERGVSDTKELLRSDAQYDADAIQFARLLCSLTYSARNFIEHREPFDDYLIEKNAEWLKSIGKTPEILRRIADEMEKVEAVAQ